MRWFGNEEASAVSSCSRRESEWEKSRLVLSSRQFEGLHTVLRHG